MNVIIFPRLEPIETGEHDYTNGKTIWRPIEEHNKIIRLFNANGIYPLLSEKRAPYSQSDLPNKDGLIITIKDPEFGGENRVYRIDQWNETTCIFGIIFYNFKTEKFTLDRVADYIYDLLFEGLLLDEVRKTRSFTKLYQRGYLRPPLVVKADVCSDTWTGTKVIRGDDVEYSEKQYPEDIYNMDLLLKAAEK